MIKVSVISFTKKGLELSEKLAKGKEEAAWEKREYKLFTKCSACMHEEGVGFVNESIGEWAGEQMRRKNAMVFVGACGIAVRAVAPYVTDKLHDSPVLVADEGGNYVIPILSGHMGGANELAVFLAQKIGAVPVITTATDLNGKFAVDLFAKKNGLAVLNKEGIARVSSKVLAGERITMSIEEGHLKEASRLSQGIQLVPYPPSKYVDIVVASEKRGVDGAVFLSPREYIIGMGCKRGKEGEKIERFIRKSMEELGVSDVQVAALASIDLKKQEAGLLSFCGENNIPFLTYSADELKNVNGEFHSSCFVEEKTGVDNVCERAALKACGEKGRLVYEKHAEDGMTIAIAKRDWSVEFDEV